MLFLTTQRMRVVHAAELPADAPRIYGDWCRAPLDAKDLTVFAVRPLSVAESSELQALPTENLSEHNSYNVEVCRRGLVDVNGIAVDAAVELSYGAVIELSSLIQDLTSGPLAWRRREPPAPSSTPEVSESAGENVSAG